MIRVHVVDDHTLVRQGIRGLLELTDDIVVRGEAADGDEALRLLESEPPDVMLLDLRMPGRDGVETLAAIRERSSGVRVLVLTTFDDDALVVQAISLGARGYLLKDVTLERLADAVRTVAAGGTVIEPSANERTRRAVGSIEPDRFHPEVGDVTTIVPLTGREVEIVRLMALGYTNREIARTVHLADGTVKNHVSNILRKFGVRDRSRAVLKAFHTGIIGGGEPDHRTGP